MIAPGPLTTVQDSGKGYARHGVSRSGAADDIALRMGNALLGNSPGAAGLEVAMGGLKFRCVGGSPAHGDDGVNGGGCAVTLTGADCGASLRRASDSDESSVVALRCNEVIKMMPGDEIELGFARDGARAYVCVHGGLDVPVVLGSRSTDLRAKMGGTRGRALQAGDLLGNLTPEKPARLLRSVNDPLRSTAVSTSSKTLQILRLAVARSSPGPGDRKDKDHATATSWNSMHWSAGRTFDVLPRSDRMAVIVSESEGIDAGDLVGGQQMSEACVSGTIQLPPDGNPVILLAEHQTTGGYKVPGVVIQADLWRVGQMRPGDKLVFEETTIDEAADALRRLHTLAAETELRPMMESRNRPPEIGTWSESDGRRAAVWGFDW